MRPLFYLLQFIFFLTVKGFSRDSATYLFHINKLPTEGVLLDKGWKFHAGDSINYAKPDYDDSKWQSINPTLDIDDLPQVQKGIRWFRLRLFINNKVRKHPLSLIIDQRGASEIYVNGKLIYQFGVVSANPEKIIAYSPGNIFGKPFLFPSTNDSIYCIAIRYALQPGLLYTTNTNWSNPVFKSKLNYLHQAVNLYNDKNRRWTGTLIFRIGCFFILFILHLSFYLYFPSQRANLYFSLFSLFVILTDSFQLPLSEITSVEYIFYNRNFVLDFILVSTFILVTAIYSLLKQKRGRVYWSLISLLFIGILLNAFTYRVGDKVSLFIIINVFNLEITRIAFAAVKQKQKGSKIIAIGTIGFLVFWSIFILGIPLNFMDTALISPYTYGDILYNLAFLSVPLATSIYLGLEFAFTSTSLKLKLAEVENLSREKQQILAAQKVLLEQQVAQRTGDLKRSFEDLKSTQAQLIQKEKMASLGELTAGIAHEIQNPLNFVNNFSEVNNELIEEMKEALTSNHQHEAIIVSDEIKENNIKIAHHGKRADAIVKGMLQHSRASTGEKEPTDINALADEYLRLAYQGQRAKDKSFNANLVTEFDPSIGLINIISQDIGRVLLNLYNNAFYAASLPSKGGFKNFIDKHQPTVWVTTSRIPPSGGGGFLISVRDNGPGIPPNIIDKIFQPFFTTKPTGQGTGLGLSLSYDIIKAHGGDLKVETNSARAGTDGEGEGAEFTIQLPAK